MIHDNKNAKNRVRARSPRQLWQAGDCAGGLFQTHEMKHKLNAINIFSQ